MTPDHETDTLEGLIARWFEIAARPIKPAHERPGREVYKKCADELAPILAGLRELAIEMPHKITNRFHRKDLCYRCLLFEMLGQPATADQTRGGTHENRNG